MRRRCKSVCCCLLSIYFSILFELSMSSHLGFHSVVVESNLLMCGMSEIRIEKAKCDRFSFSLQYKKERASVKINLQMDSGQQQRKWERFFV